MNYVTVRRPATTTQNGVGSLSSFDQLFDSVFGRGPAWDDRKPAVDIQNGETSYTIEADLPGTPEDRIEVRVEDNLLIISSREAENGDGREQASADNAAKYVLRERRSGAFHRSFAMPKDADPNNIEAVYRNGVLTVTLHKKPEAKPRQIEINRG